MTSSDIESSHFGSSQALSSILGPPPAKSSRLSLTRKSHLESNPFRDENDLSQIPGELCNMVPKEAISKLKAISPLDIESSTQNLSLIQSPQPAKRNRLSLRRKTQLQNIPCYEENDGPLFSESLFHKLPKRSTGVVDTVDLTKSEVSSTTDSSDTKSTLLYDFEYDADYHIFSLGLPNCGNTCYVSSILQVLRYSPNFLSSLHILLSSQSQLPKISNKENEAKELSFFNQLHALYIAMRRKEMLKKANSDKDYSLYLLKPVQVVINSLREISVLFEEGEQHDAHELLMTIVSSFTSLHQMLIKKFPKPEENEGIANSISSLDSPTQPSIKFDVEEGSPAASVPSPGVASLPSPDVASLPSVNIASLPSPDVTSVPSPVISTSSDVKPEQLSAAETVVAKAIRRQRRKPKPSFDFASVAELDLGMEGKIRRVVKCLECEVRLEREESFANLELNVPEMENEEDSVDVRSCLSQTTKLVGENKFFCDGCKRRQEAQMSSEVIALPPVLLLHFSWLSSNSVMTNKEKASLKVMIPLKIHTSENPEVFMCMPPQNYTLYAIVLHIGKSTEGGHYVAFVKDAYQNLQPSSSEDEKVPRPRLSLPNSFSSKSPESCCSTEEIFQLKDIESSTKWLLFDDNVVLPVHIEDDSESFPYYNYLSLTASPCLIFYHKM